MCWVYKLFTLYVPVMPYDDYCSLISVHCTLGKIGLSTTHNRKYVTTFCMTLKHLLNLVPLVHLNLKSLPLSSSPANLPASFYYTGFNSQSMVPS